jgi:putative FmdB family regulatory protein
MPVYEYRCTACNHKFELRQKFSDAPADECPKCSGAVHKMVSAAAFSLKGGGWYGDGYNMKTEVPKSESDSAIGAGTGTETAADSASKDSAPTDSTPKDSTTKETTASPAATSSAQSQSGTKSAVGEKPAAKEKPKSKK